MKCYGKWLHPAKIFFKYPQNLNFMMYETEPHPANAAAMRHGLC